MIRREDTDTRLFRTFVRSESLARTRREAEEADSLASYAEALAWLERGAQDSLSEVDLADLYRRLRDTSPILGTLFLVQRWLEEDERLSASEIDHWRGAIEQAASGDGNVDRALLDCFHAIHLLENDHPEDAYFVTDEALERINEIGGLPAEYGCMLLHATRAALQSQNQELEDARDSLRLAFGLARSHSFARVWPMALALAQVLHLRGEYEEALGVALDGTLEDDAEKHGELTFLIDMKLIAAHCGVETRDPDRAFNAVVAAGELLQSFEENQLVTQRCELLLRSGEVEALLENYDESNDLLHATADAFEALNPPDYRGALEARIALAERALTEESQETARTIVQRLLEETEPLELSEELPEYVSLRTYPFATCAPPTLNDYRELLPLVQAIRSPLLLFRSLANMYIYALQYLDNYDQARLLIQLRNMNRQIAPETYAHIYQRHVSSRYSFAIENRLGRITQRGYQD